MKQHECCIESWPLFHQYIMLFVRKTQCFETSTNHIKKSQHESSHHQAPKSAWFVDVSCRLYAVFRRALVLGGTFYLCVKAWVWESFRSLAFATGYFVRDEWRWDKQNDGKWWINGSYCQETSLGKVFFLGGGLKVKWLWDKLGVIILNLIELEETGRICRCVADSIRGFPLETIRYFTQVGKSCALAEGTSWIPYRA